MEYSLVVCSVASWADRLGFPSADPKAVETVDPLAVSKADRSVEMSAVSMA